MIPVISRKDAKSSGQLLYFTGKPCKYGHVDERWVSSFCCRTCSKLKLKDRDERWKIEQPDRVKARWIAKAERDKERARIDPEFRARIRSTKRKYKKTIKGKDTDKRYRASAKTHERVNAYAREYAKARAQSDPVYAMKCRLRARVATAYNRAALASAGVRKAMGTSRLLGCTYGEFAAHIESMFKVGMTWDNRGLWHIDHIKPIAAFDLSDPAQAKAAFHYSNCQPLWAEENMKKGAKFQSVDCRALPAANDPAPQRNAA